MVQCSLGLRGWHLGWGKGRASSPGQSYILSNKLFLSALLPLCRDLWIQAKELVRSMKENQVRIRLTPVGAARVCCEAIRPNTPAVAP